jgi:2-(1,2-epoxy-1,2-dihydrophenyl)acetyl-CoA isomerase
MKTIAYGAHRLVTALQDCQKPVLASVQGTAAGLGVQLALACDLVLMAEEASFIEVFVRRGLVADGGAAYLLTRLAGLQRAKELMLLGDRISAAQAREYGLVTDVVPGDRLEARTAELAATLARGPTVALGLMKRLANRALDGDRTGALFDETLAQELAAKSADGQAGVAAFAERRPAEFRGY